MRGHLQQEIQPVGSRTKQSPPSVVGEFPAAGRSHSALPDGSDPQTPDEKGDSDNSNAGAGIITCSCRSSDHRKSGSSCGIAAGILIFLIKIYQKAVSPLFPGCCRFYPTCSHYAVEALRVHGLFRGIALSAWRIMRCQPWCRGGYDPVPPPKSGRNNNEV